MQTWTYSYSYRVPTYIQGYLDRNGKTAYRENEELFKRVKERVSMIVPHCLNEPTLLPDTWTLGGYSSGVEGTGRRLYTFYLGTA